MGSSAYIVVSLLTFLSVSLATHSIPAFECESGVPVPPTVTMDCEGMSRGTCLLRKGQTHTLTAEFTPGKSSATNLQSYVAWKNWVEMPLPGQNSTACGNYVDCPLSQGTQTTFTYPLEIQNFWMRRRYPMKWKLTDEDTDETIFCFVMKIQIV